LAFTSGYAIEPAWQGKSLAKKCLAAPGFVRSEAGWTPPKRLRVPIGFALPAPQVRNLHQARPGCGRYEKFCRSTASAQTQRAIGICSANQMSEHPPC